MKKKQAIRLTESQLHKVIKESVRKILKEMHSDDDWQVNVVTNCDGTSWASVTEWSPEGYRGRLINTRYANGDYDYTDWCVYSGSKEDCEEMASKINKNY